MLVPLFTCFNTNLMRDVPEWKVPIYIMQKRMTLLRKRHWQRPILIA